MAVTGGEAVTDGRDGRPSLTDDGPRPRARGRVSRRPNAEGRLNQYFMYTVFNVV